VPLPDNDGNYYVIFELWDDQGVPEGSEAYPSAQQIRNGVRLASPERTDEFEVITPFLNQLVEHERANFSLQRTEDFPEARNSGGAADALTATYARPDQGVTLTHKLLKHKSADEASNKMNAEINAQARQGFLNHDQGPSWVALRQQQTMTRDGRVHTFYTGKEQFYWIDSRHRNVLNIVEAPNDYALDFFSG
jgi:hypothetical protein